MKRILQKDLLIIIGIIFVYYFIKYHPGIITKEAICDTITNMLNELVANKDKIADNFDKISDAVICAVSWIYDRLIKPFLPYKN